MSSCFSFFLCRRKKSQDLSYRKPSKKNKSIDQNTVKLHYDSKISTLMDQPPKLRASFPCLNSYHSTSIASHRSSIAVKNSAKFLPLIQSSERTETSNCEYTINTNSQRISTDSAINGVPLAQKSRAATLANINSVTWSKRYSNENPLTNYNSPFVSNSATHKPKIVPTTPENFLRRKLFPKISNNNDAQLFNQNSNKQFNFDMNIDEFDGESSNSLVNL
ncbi:unnamed protein product [Blepharisma stoltei]|uniref:Uncharacterized protein n=1 Tax=Blepharisma stoltei TaxID=1481888 RepID=A0AAU9ISE9_9CILI|nr:unnamed protein product [Blepharisma stoltei]